MQEQTCSLIKLKFIGGIQFILLTALVKESERYYKAKHLIVFSAYKESAFSHFHPHFSIGLPADDTYSIHTALYVFISSVFSSFTLPCI